MVEALTRFGTSVVAVERKLVAMLCCRSDEHRPITDEEPEWHTEKAIILNKTIEDEEGGNDCACCE